MINLKIILEDILTPINCSILIKEIIKYIAYNSKQIPHNYEIFSRMLLNRQRNFMANSESIDESAPVLSMKETKVHIFYKKMNAVFENFESTFKSLENELCLCSDIREVMVIIGPNISVPKHIIRILIPSLAVGHSIAYHPARKNLLSVYRNLLECNELSDSLFKTNGPTNMFILLGLLPNSDGPKSSNFHPVDHINLKQNVQKTIIDLTNPLIENVDCNCEINNDNIKLNSNNYENYIYFKSITIINGFKDFKIDGVSALNIFRTLPITKNF
ncbi:hypothetical protein O3M35_003849 [Rhynocoris fuscipes]|uniref:Uncharacterized protein n=1 Tax=Rhynocoris fuscipes TaxID=488301 RepID=A0AAW1CKD4_9HEMI